jgi:F420-dependent oxidoreductase-like protein
MSTIGLKLSPQLVTIEQLRGVWQVADEAGFDHVWAFDHFNPIFADVAGDIYEGMTLLAAMAEATSRVRIGLMVAGNTYRHPAVMAKMATTIDHLSGGRLEFGLGAAWAEIEHTMLDIPFPPVGQRIRRLGEALTVIRALWTEDVASFEGRYYNLREAVSNPKPVQQPYPPIWIGGSGEKLTLRVVAEHADVWNVMGSVEECVRKRGVLDAHCADVGRDPAAIKGSTQFQFNAEDVDGTLETIAAYEAAGFTENILYIPSAGDPVKAAEIAAEQILPRLRCLRAKRA